MAHSLPSCLRSKVNKARKGFAGDRAVSPSSPGRSRTTRHGRTHWCCWIGGTGAWDLLEPGALKAFPSASQFPTQTKAQRIYCPLTAQARGLRSEEVFLMPRILALTPRRYLHAPNPKNQTISVWHPGMPCGRPVPAIASCSLPHSAWVLPGHVPWPAERGARERVLKILAKGLSTKHVVVMDLF